MIVCGDKLRSLRKAKHLTQVQVAERVGVSKAMISAYETDSKLPSLEILLRLSRLYGTTVDYLVCTDSPKILDISGLSDESRNTIRVAKGEKEAVYMCFIVCLR